MGRTLHVCHPPPPPHSGYGVSTQLIASKQLHAREKRYGQKKKINNSNTNNTDERTQKTNLFCTKSLTWIEYFSEDSAWPTRTHTAGDDVTTKGFCFYTSLIQFYLFTHEISLRQNSILSCRWHWAAFNVPSYGSFTTCSGVNSLHKKKQTNNALLTSSQISHAA